MFGRWRRERRSAAPEEEHTRRAIATLECRLTIEAARVANAAFLETVSTPRQPVPTATRLADELARMGLEPTPTKMMDEDDYAEERDMGAEDEMPYSRRRHGTQQGDICAMASTLTAFRFSPLWGELLSRPNADPATMDGPSLLLSLMVDQFLRRAKFKEVCEKFDNAEHALVFAACADLLHMMDRNFTDSVYYKWFSGMGLRKKLQLTLGSRRPANEAQQERRQRIIDRESSSVSLAAGLWMQDFTALVRRIIKTAEDRHPRATPAMVQNTIKMLQDGRMPAIRWLVDNTLAEMNEDLRRQGRAVGAQGRGSREEQVYPDGVKQLMAAAIVSVMGVPGTPLDARVRYLETVKENLTWHQAHAIGQYSYPTARAKVEKVTCKPLTGCLERLILQIGPDPPTEALKAAQRQLGTLLNRMRRHRHAATGDIVPQLLRQLRPTPQAQATDPDLAASLREVGRGYTAAPGTGREAVRGPLNTARASLFYQQAATGVRIRKRQGKGRYTEPFRRDEDNYKEEPQFIVPRVPLVPKDDDGMRRLFDREGNLIDPETYQRFYAQEKAEKYYAVTFEEELDAAVECYIGALMLTTVGPTTVHFQAAGQAPGALLGALLSQIPNVRLYQLQLVPRVRGADPEFDYPPLTVPRPDVKPWVDGRYARLQQQPQEQRAVILHRHEPERNVVSGFPKDLEDLITNGMPMQQYHTHVQLSMVLITIEQRVARFRYYRGKKDAKTPDYHQMALSFPQSAAKPWPRKQWLDWMVAANAGNRQRKVQYGTEENGDPKWLETSEWGMPLFGEESRAMPGAADALPSATQCTLLDTNMSKGVQVSEIMNIHDEKFVGWPANLFGSGARAPQYKLSAREGDDGGKYQVQLPDGSMQTRYRNDGNAKLWLVAVELVWITTNETRIGRAESARAAQRMQDREEPGGGDDPGPSAPPPPAGEGEDGDDEGIRALDLLQVIDGGGGAVADNDWGQDQQDVVQEGDQPTPQGGESQPEPPLEFAISGDMFDGPRPGLPANRVPNRALTPNERAIAVDLTDPNAGEAQEVIATLDNDRPGAELSITREDLRRLQPVEGAGSDAWINGHLVDYYTDLLQQRNDAAVRPDTWLLRCRFFNAYFWDYATQSQLNAQAFADKVHGYNWVQSFVFGKHELLLIPINKTTRHFTLAVVNFKNRRYEYFDSYLAMSDARTFGTRVLGFVRNWLAIEWRKRYGTEWVSSDLHGGRAWTSHVWGADKIPQQTNEQDCGLFMLKFADYYARNAPIDFTQDTMSYFRQRTAVEVSQGRLLEPVQGPYQPPPPPGPPPGPPPAPPPGPPPGPRRNPTRVRQGPNINKQKLALAGGQLIALGNYEPSNGPAWPPEDYMNLPENMTLDQWQEVLQLAMYDPGQVVVAYLSGRLLGPTPAPGMMSRVYSMIADRLPESKVIALNVGEFLDVDDAAFDKMCAAVKASNVVHLFFEDPRTAARKKQKQDVKDHMREVNAYKPGYLEQLSRREVYDLGGVNAWTKFKGMDNKEVWKRRANDYLANPAQWLREEVGKANAMLRAWPETKEARLRPYIQARLDMLNRERLE